MKIESIEQLINLFMEKGFLFEKLVEEKCGVDYDYSVKSFSDMGLDELDIIEVAMEIEKQLNCVITDEFLDTWSLTDPAVFTRSRIRDMKLTQLGIE